MFAVLIVVSICAAPLIWRWFTYKPPDKRDLEKQAEEFVKNYSKK